MNYRRRSGYIQFGENVFSKNANGIKIYHDVFLLMKFVQTRPQVKSMNIIYYDV